MGYIGGLQLLPCYIFLLRNCTKCRLLLVLLTFTSRQTSQAFDNLMKKRQCYQNGIGVFFSHMSGCIRPNQLTPNWFHMLSILRPRAIDPSSKSYQSFVKELSILCQRAIDPSSKSYWSFVKELLILCQRAIDPSSKSYWSFDKELSILRQRAINPSSKSYQSFIKEHLILCQRAMHFQNV